MAEIRDYTPEDYLPVRAALEEGGIFYEGRDSAENYRALTESDLSFILVAEEEGELVGSIVAQQFGRSLGFLWSAAVAEGFRRRGIATQLMSEAEERLRSNGVREIWGFVDVVNEASQSLLRSHGWEFNTNNKYYGPWKTTRTF
ncbi:MAG TPA: GNAT family N-acetyltransferase [Candidatus Saccharimonadales bacterium]|nr:GNAT family N-acetyltransferase [Candidatus Saccharimonadales bacterium]